MLVGDEKGKLCRVVLRTGLRRKSLVREKSEVRPKIRNIFGDGGYIFNTSKKLFHRVYDRSNILLFFWCRCFPLCCSILCFGSFTHTFAEFIDIMPKSSCELDCTSKARISAGSTTVRSHI
jgi:hypothetical protein